MTPAPSGPGVYFIQAGPGGPIKIGKTQSIKDRMRLRWCLYFVSKSRAKGAAP